MFNILMVVVLSLYTTAIIHQLLHLKQMKFITCKLYPNGLSTNKEMACNVVKSYGNFANQAKELSTVGSRKNNVSSNLGKIHASERVM